MENDFSDPANSRPRGRTPNRPELTALAKTLRNDWPNWSGIQATELEIKQRRMSRDGYSMRNCYFSGFTRDWQCKLFIGGAQHILGTSSNCAQVARFADCAILFFWKYRKTSGNRECTDSDLNFSVAQARSDLAAHPITRNILETFERYLLDSGELKPIAPKPGKIQTPEDALRNLQIAFGCFRKAAQAAASHLRPEYSVVSATFSEHLIVTEKFVASVATALTSPKPQNQNEQSN